MNITSPQRDLEVSVSNETHFSSQRDKALKCECHLQSKGGTRNSAICRYSFMRYERYSLTATINYLFARHHLNSTIYHIHLMERSCAYLLFGVHSVGIAAYLGFCLFDSGSHLDVCRLAVEIFQFNDVGVLHIVVYFLARTEEDVGITVLIVKFGDGTIEPAQARKGKGEAMHKLSLQS